jgi:flagellar basal body-associated protein FliL
MKSKLKFLIPVLLLAFGGTYKFVLAKPAPVPPAKVAGEVYVLPKDFMINLQGGQWLKLGVALVLKPKPADAAKKKDKGSAAAKPPDGYGAEPQEALVRAIVTDVLTDVHPSRLRSHKGRKNLQKKILAELKHSTDVKVKKVVFTDVAVQ